MFAVTFKPQLKTSALGLSCGDIYQVYGSMQVYSPVTVEVDYSYTTGYGGRVSPIGQSSIPALGPTTTTTFSKFTINQNATYDAYLFITYPSTIIQNVTLTIQEGTRGAVTDQICMDGTTIYFHWLGLVVVTQPSYPTPVQIAQASDADLKAQLTQSNANTAAIAGDYSFLATVTGIGWATTLFAVWSVRRKISNFFGMRRQ